MKPKCYREQTLRPPAEGPPQSRAISITRHSSGPQVNGDDHVHQRQIRWYQEKFQDQHEPMQVSFCCRLGRTPPQVNSKRDTPEDIELCEVADGNRSSERYERWIQMRQRCFRGRQLLASAMQQRKKTDPATQGRHSGAGTRGEEW